MPNNILNTFKEIEIQKPGDIIIEQIRTLIGSGQLKPGDRLPSERMLSDRFGVGRTYVRDAIKKLEFYGILRTNPQSGTVVAGLGITALEGLITDVLELQGRDFKSIVETRVILELNSAKLAALRRENEDIISIANAMNAYDEAVAKGESAYEEDLLFHLTIAEASKNSVLKSLMLIVAPDIISQFQEKDVCAGEKPKRAVEEHHRILECIKDQDPDGAEEVMRLHLQAIVDLSVINITMEEDNE